MSEPSSSVSATAEIVNWVLDSPAAIVIGATLGNVNSPSTDSVAV